MQIPMNEASYETSFALVLYDSPLSESQSNKTDANKAAYETQLTRLHYRTLCTAA